MAAGRLASGLAVERIELAAAAVREHIVSTAPTVVKRISSTTGCVAFVAQQKRVCLCVCLCERLSVSVSVGGEVAVLVLEVPRIKRTSGSGNVPG